MLPNEDPGKYNRQKWSRKPSSSHLAGIVPVAAPPLEFKMPWDDALMPIGTDYLAIENSVHECVMAGCNTIWIVCHMGTKPLLRKRIGDTIYRDPKSNYVFNADFQAIASIYYVPMDPKFVDVRDSLSWSVAYGANMAYSISRFMSQWIMPGKFYCSFPYGIKDNNFVRQYRSQIRESDKNIYFSHNGKTVKDGLHASFTFDAREYKKFRDTIKKYSTKKWFEEGCKTANPNYKIARKIKLEEAFATLDFETYSNIEYPWFYDISTWDGYTKFMSSGIRLEKDYSRFTMKEVRKSLYEAI